MQRVVILQNNCTFALQFKELIIKSCGKFIPFLAKASKPNTA
jgi:hypothetical protein